MAKLRRTDLSKYNDGVWAPHPDGWSVKVRSADCPRVRERTAKEMTLALGRTSADKLSDDEWERLMRTVYAEEVIVDWKDIDEAPEFTVEKAREFMLDPEQVEFRHHVESSARNLRQYERLGAEKIAKN